MDVRNFPLCPKRDARDFLRAVESGLVNAKKNVHRGRPCTSTACDLCAELVGSVYEAVFRAYKASGESSGWAFGLITAAARNAYYDRVRRRMVDVGLVARPERWLRKASFLPGESVEGRALVVATVFTVGYYSVLPTAGSRIVVDDDSLARMLDGLRPSGSLASVRKFWAYDRRRDRFADVRFWCRNALDTWRRTEPKRYGALLVLNAMNAEPWLASMDEPRIADRLGVTAEDPFGDQRGHHDRRVCRRTVHSLRTRAWRPVSHSWRRVGWPPVAGGHPTC